MNPGRIHPREEQVAELTRGQRLPLAPVHETHLKFIAEMLTGAWNDLLEKRRSILLSGGEIEINALIEARLITLLEEDKLWAQLVRAVARGKETVSFDGSHLEKQPDLSIYLTNRSRAFPLVVECKLIDAPLKKTINLYCDAGLARFLRGEYGWAAREAFMLAYVRDGSTIWSCLKPFLAEAKMIEPDRYLTEAPPESIGGTATHLARSSHARGFHYIGQPQKHPGPIAIWHLWIATTPR